MGDRLWDAFVNALMATFLPLISCYYALCGNVFLNVSAQNASRLEWAGNTLLSPVQYILAGREATPKGDGSWEWTQRFDYSRSFWPKVLCSALTLPSSLLVGSATKGASFLDPSVRARHASLVAASKSKQIRSNLAYYEKIGLPLTSSPELFVSQGHQRRPGDEQTLLIEKRALQEVTALLNKAQIPWWVDCGTCLGAYRYGGVIPWDSDIDIAVLLPDFANVWHALNELDPKKYQVQDWSTRERPKSYLKVYIRESRTLIDIYHFAIRPEKKEIEYIFSLETHLFFPEWWKIRERRFKVPVAFETVFPLKKGKLDGMEVFLPNDTKKYLQRYYGANLDPAKVYDATTGLYEKDLSHPYWENSYAH